MYHSDSPQAFLGWYERILDDRGSLKFEESRRAVGKEFSEEEFRYRVHTVNAALKRALGSKRGADYTQRKSWRYTLTLPADAITDRERTMG